MQELLNKIGSISLEKILQLEETDLQYISLKSLYKNLEHKEFYLALIISNSIICYQLSSTGEKYWKEFSSYFSLEENNISKICFLEEKLTKFISNSLGNKRFISIKQKRIQKLIPLLEKIENSYEYYYNNMSELQIELAKIMNQKSTDKTIVFAVKMFGYGARICFNKTILYPENICIPLDSRIIKIYELYNIDPNLSIQKFYEILSKKTNIPPLHLDSVLWINSKNLL